MTNTLEGVETRENDNFRIRMVKQADLRDQLNKEHKTVKWGKHLRAPQVYVDLLKEHSDKLTLINKVAEVKRGFTTGINDFFYLDEEKIKHWGIETEFLAPVMKSPKESDSIAIDVASLEQKVLLCDKTEKALRKAGKNGVLNYIEWGSKQVANNGIVPLKADGCS